MNATLSMRVIALVCGLLVFSAGAVDAETSETLVEPAPLSGDDISELEGKADSESGLGDMIAGQEPDNVMGRYLLSRALDFSDIISFDVGIGASALPHVQITKFFQLGFGGRTHGRLAGAGTPFFEWRRRFGAYHENSWEFSFLPWTVEYLNRQGIGSVENYSYSHSGINEPEDDIYTQRRDFWAIGADANLILDVLLEFHPIEFVDFFVGWFNADISEDDVIPEADWHRRI